MDDYAQHRQDVSITSIQKSSDNSTLLLIIIKITKFFERNKGRKLPKILPLLVVPFTPKSDFIDFTLSNARRFYSSKGDPLGVKGLMLSHDKV